MPSNTPNLNLLKKDPLTDGNDTFNIQTMLNDNWDKIDTAVGNNASQISSLTTKLNQSYIPHVGSTTAGDNDSNYTINFSGAGISPLPNGLRFTVTFHDESPGGSDVTIKLSSGNKALMKASGSAVKKVYAGTYLLQWNGMAFILLGEGGGEYGTATAADVLETATVGTEDGVVNGTIPVITNGSRLNSPDAWYNDGDGMIYAKVPPLQYYEDNVYIRYADSDFNAANVRDGVNIFGLTGTFTNDATALANQILYGRTAYVKGSKVMGTMPNNGAVIITPSNVNQTINSGYHNGSGVVLGDSNFVDANIRAGKTIFTRSGTFKGCIKKVQDYVLTGDMEGTSLNGFKVIDINIFAGNVNNMVGFLPDISNKVWTNRVMVSVIRTVSGQQRMQVYAPSTFDSANDTCVVRVVEFEPDTVNIQAAPSALLTTGASRDVTLTTAVDLNNAFLLSSLALSGVGNSGASLAPIFLDDSHVRYFGVSGQSVFAKAYIVSPLSDFIDNYPAKAIQKV